MSQKKITRIPLLLLSFHSLDEIGRRMRGLGRVLSLMRPSLKKELDGLDIKLDPGSYAVGAFFSALIYGVLFSLLSYLLLYFLGGLSPELMVRVPILIAFGFFMIFFMLHLIYPSIIIKKVAVREDKDLLFALREIMLGVNSGVPLFESLRNVSIGNYGYVSDDFTMVVKDIENGKSEKEALKALVLRTESEYLRRAIWQMVNTLESGASMTTALPGIVNALENHTYRMIRSYSSNLNFLMLIYMLIAAAIPSLGITFLVLLSAFSGFGVSVDKILGLIFGAAIGQVIMIGYMGSTRPAIFGG